METGIERMVIMKLRTVANIESGPSLGLDLFMSSGDIG